MDSQQLNELLACANLQGYHKEMIDMGYDDVPHILNMSPHDTNILCEDIFGSKRGHRYSTINVPSFRDIRVIISPDFEASSI